MKKTKTKNTESVSMNEEMMIWCAYRYAIGRHTYVSDLAPYIAQKYYEKFDDKALKHFSDDIINEINNSLSFGSILFHYEGSVSYNERDGLADIFRFFKEYNINEEKDFGSITDITVYKESYAKEAPKLFSIKRQDPPPSRYLSKMDFDDLIPWYTLARFFDKSTYKWITVNHDGKKEKIVAFETYAEETECVDETQGIYKYKPWGWRKVYIDIDYYYCSPNHCGYISPQYIELIEDYKKNEEDL